MFGNQTANAIIAVEKKFGFQVDQGVAGREVLGALDLTLRGWKPPPEPTWGGVLAHTIIPVAQRKITKALSALDAIRTMLQFGGFDFVTADGVTMAALKTHFKLVSPGETRLANEEPISVATIDPLIANYDDDARGHARHRQPLRRRHHDPHLGVHGRLRDPDSGKCPAQPQRLRNLRRPHGPAQGPAARPALRSGCRAAAMRERM
jgi:hypothetical protein